MKILIISPFFPPENQIAAHRIFSFAKTWSVAGHEVQVITRVPLSAGFHPKIPPNLLIHRVLDPLSFFNTDVRSKRQSPRKPARTSWSRTVKWVGARLFFPDHFLPFFLLATRLGVNLKTKPDVIVASVGPLSAALFGLFLSKTLKRPLVVDYRDLIIDYGMDESAWRSPRTVALHWCERMILRNSSLVSSVSDSLGMRLVEKGASNVKTIRNGFDDSQSREKDMDSQLLPTDTKRSGNAKPPRGKIQIGTVARFHPQKGHLCLLSALEEVIKVRDDWELSLVGEGTQHSNEVLRFAIEDHGLEHKVRMVGPTTNITGFYASLDLHILPSSYGEGFPNVVAESMLAGVPNIVTDVGEGAIIVGKTGWIVPPDSTRDLREAILTALDEGKVALRKRGERAKLSVEREFPVQRMVTRYREVYDASPKLGT